MKSPDIERFLETPFTHQKSNELIPTIAMFNIKGPVAGFPTHHFGYPAAVSLGVYRKI